MPYSFSKVTSDVVTFSHNNAMLTYNYRNKTVSEEIKYSEDAKNNEYNSEVMLLPTLLKIIYM